MRWLAILFVLALGGAEAQLDVVIRPNCGAPAFVSPGGEFRALLTKQTALRLSRAETAYALEASWRELPGGRYEATCQMADNLLPGTYAVEAESGKGWHKSRNAVVVRASYPKSYLIAYLATPDLAASADVESRVMEAAGQGVPASDPEGNADERLPLAFVLTRAPEGGEAEYRRLVSALEKATMPVVVAPPLLKDADRYTRHFGPLPRAFRFGHDGYLLFGDAGMHADGTAQDDAVRLQLLRRQIMDCRWSTGVTPQFSPLSGMRTQLVLFVDNPLDFLLVGSEQDDASDTSIPWGATRLVPAGEAEVTVLEVSPSGVGVRTPEPSAEPPASPAENQPSDDEP